MRKEALEEIILKTVDIPGFPPVAMKVLHLTDNDYSSLNELEEIIVSDQSFTSRLLRIANSPYYGRGKVIETISTAIIFIGFSTMKKLVIAASLKDLHKKFGLLEQRLWEHSLGTSIAASLIATETQMAKPDEALIAGLIHDIGKTVLNNSIPESYTRVIERVYEEEVSFMEVEDDLLGFNHCSVGGLIARRWKLPESLEVVIKHHHTKAFPAFEGNSFEALCEVVKAADAICLNLGISLRRPLNIPFIEFEHLGLSEENFEKLQERVKKIYAEQRAQLLE